MREVLLFIVVSREGGRHKAAESVCRVEGRKRGDDSVCKAARAGWLDARLALGGPN